MSKDGITITIPSDENKEEKVQTSDLPSNENGINLNDQRRNNPLEKPCYNYYSQEDITSENEKLHSDTSL